VKCDQCERPAIARVTEGLIALCLDCYQKFVYINNVEFLKHAALANQALDDMDRISGFPTAGGRIPIAELARAVQKGSVYNNIHISNSQVGVVSAAEVARIDAAITLTQGSDAAVLGEQLKRLTEAVVNNGSISAEDRKELIDLLQSLAEQIVGQRKPAVVRSLANAISDKVKGAIALAPLAHDLIEAIRQFFS
jgi:polyhydroxyalkanoate synthesis regulator phasin